MSLLQAIVLPIISIVQLVVFVNIILSWLIGFNVINGHNQFVAMIYRATSALTEPLLSPIRRFLPPLGGMDFSPVVLLLILFLIQNIVSGSVTRII